MPGSGRGHLRSNSTQHSASVDKLPDHVKQHVDPDTKETYYHDTLSRTVSWQRPVDASWNSNFSPDSSFGSFQEGSKRAKRRHLDSQHIAMLVVSGGGMLTACILDASTSIRLAVAGAFFVLQLVLMLHHSDKQQREAEGLREHSQSMVVQQVNETFELRDSHPAVPISDGGVASGNRPSKSASREAAGEFATNPTIPVQVSPPLPRDQAAESTAEAREKTPSESARESRDFNFDIDYNKMPQNRMRAALLLNDLMANGFCEAPAQLITGKFHLLRLHRFRTSVWWWCLVILSIAGLVGLVGIEPPIDEQNDILFGAGVSRANLWKLYTVEALLLGIITIDFILQLLFFGVQCLWKHHLVVAGRLTKNRHVRIRQLHATLIFMLWIAFFARASVPESERIFTFRALRPLLFITKVGPFHRLVYLIGRTLVKQWPLFAFLFMVVFVWGLGGLVLFGNDGCAPGTANYGSSPIDKLEADPGSSLDLQTTFKDISNAMLALFNLLHNEGLPELLRAKYCSSTTSTSFFIVFVVAVQFFLLNIMIGRFYIEYKDHKLFHFLRNRAQEFDVLSAIFDLIVDDRRSLASQAAPIDKVMEFNCWEQFVKVWRPKWRSDMTKAAYEQLRHVDMGGKDGMSAVAMESVSVYQFISVIDCLADAKAKLQKRKRYEQLLNDSSKDITQSGGVTVIESHDSQSDKLIGNAQPSRLCRRLIVVLARQIKSQGTWRTGPRRTMYVILVLNFAILTLYGDESRFLSSVAKSELDYVLLVFLVLHVLETSLKAYLIIAVQRKNYRHYADRNGIDFIIVTCAALYATVAALYNGNLTQSRFAMSLVTLRVFTLFTVFQKMMRTLVQVVVPFRDLLGLLLTFFFFFAILGNQMFINRYCSRAAIALNITVLGDESCNEIDAQSDGFGFHFNTLVDSLLTLFSLFMGEESNDVMWRAVKVFGLKASLYFVLFQVTMVWMIGNLFVGIVLDTVLQMTKIEQRDKELLAEKQKELQQKGGISEAEAKQRLATHDKFSRQKTRRQVEKDLYGFHDDGTDRDEAIMSMAHNSHRIKMSKEETHAKVKFKKGQNVLRAVHAFKVAGRTNSERQSTERQSKVPADKKARAVKGLLHLARSGGVIGDAEATPASGEVTKTPASGEVTKTPASGEVTKTETDDMDLDEAVV